MIHYRTAAVGDHQIFYREAGDPNQTSLLLLHGFPSSSHMFRNLIPLLADRFHFVAVWESTPAGLTSRIARLTFSGVSPPARITGLSASSTRRLLTRQSWVLPVAPDARVFGSKVSVINASTNGDNSPTIDD